MAGQRHWVNFGNVQRVEVAHYGDGLPLNRRERRQREGRRLEGAVTPICYFGPIEQAWRRLRRWLRLTRGRP